MSDDLDPAFTFSVHTSHTIHASEIWDDDNRPENPTIRDVLRYIDEHGGAANFISDFGLAEDLDLDVDGRPVS